MYVCLNNLSIYFNFWLYMYVLNYCELSLNLLVFFYNMGDIGVKLGVIFIFCVLILCRIKFFIYGIVYDL